jgi:hypothetical protein
MKLLKRARTFWLIDKKTKLLLVEAFILLGWARLLKNMSFAKVAPTLGEQMNETSFCMEEANRKQIKHVSHAINIMSRYTVWESMCLVKAIAAMKMLEKRKIESTIYFGTAKGENGKMIAHAWLRSGPFYVTGEEEMERFIVVSKFAKKNK